MKSESRMDTGAIATPPSQWSWPISEISWMGGVAMAPVSILLSLFIMLLEVLVAFIQAYIFTLLSAIFIGMYAHPAH